MKELLAQHPRLYQGALCKWQKARVERQWDLAMKVSPRICNRYSDYPNYFKETLGMAHLIKGRTPWSFVPKELQILLDRVLCEQCDTKRQLRPENFESLFTEATEIWNEVAKDGSAQPDGSDVTVKSHSVGAWPQVECKANIFVEIDVC